MAVADLAGIPPIDTPAAPSRRGPATLWGRVRDFLPRGNLLDDAVWQKRHNILQWLLLLHLPALTLFGFYMKHPAMTILITVTPIAVFRILGGLPRNRRLASFFTTAGIVYCSAALVSLADGAIEAHFHFFIIVGFIALYEDWVPFGWNIVFTVLSHGVGSAFRPNSMFNHASAMHHPWTWSLIHGVAVLAACVGVVLFWRTNEDEQIKTLALTKDLSDAEIQRRKFASELLVNLARRNQSLLYRQLEIIGQLEHAERDPDALAGLFRLDHLATRIRRNAENLLVLSGEEPPRVWGKPVPLTDVVRAAIAETEDLSRVTFVVDERLAVLGHAVIDLTHLLAELIENAVRSSPPESQVTVRTTPDIRSPGSVMITVEDWGVGMPEEHLAEANAVLAAPRDVDALVSNRLGLHVVARLAHRYAIQVVLTATAGSGITAVVLLPPALFINNDRPRTVATSGQFATPAGLPVAGALEAGALPQRIPRPDGPLNGTGRVPSNGTGARSPVGPPDQPSWDSLTSGPLNGLTSGPASGSISSRSGGASGPTGAAISQWNGGSGGNPIQPNGQPKPKAPEPSNRLDSAATTRPDDAPRSEPNGISQSPAVGIRIPRTGPDWDGWWESEAAARAAGMHPDQNPPEASDPQINDATEVGSNGIVHGVTLTVSDAHSVADVRSASEVNKVSDVHSAPVSPDAPLRLSRRTPQAHLAPELQRDRQSAERQQAAAQPAAPPPDAARAREALSRYQASRRAALAENDNSEGNRP
jgi:signal transduction histidine kinase